MWCAYVFAGLAIYGGTGVKWTDPFQVVQWISQTFLQLVLLSIIMVGQNIMAQASDKRAEMTYKDAEATFHEAREIQAHLKEQDDAINSILDRLEKLAGGAPKA